MKTEYTITEYSELLMKLMKKVLAKAELKEDLRAAQETFIGKEALDKSNANSDRDDINILVYEDNWYYENGYEGISSVLDEHSDISATHFIGGYNSEDLSNYDVLFNIRGANLLNFDSLIISNGVHKDEIKKEGIDLILKKYEVVVNFIQTELKW